MRRRPDFKERCDEQDLVLYYSSYGHVEKMADAIAEGVRKVAGTEVTIKRVPELVPADVAEKAHFKLDQKPPVATVDELPGYDAIIFGTPTRFGNMTSQMRNFLDQTGGLGQGRLDRQGRQRLGVDSDTAWRPGNHHHVVPRYAGCIRWNGAEAFLTGHAAMA